jgi:hypothetical protein
MITLKSRHQQGIYNPIGRRFVAIAKKHIPPDIDEAPKPGVFNREAVLEFIRWLREDDEQSPEEQAQVLSELMRALDEDRPEGRKLFPDQ